MILAEICIGLISLCCMVATDWAAALGLGGDLAIDGTFRVGTSATMEDTSTLRAHTMDCLGPTLAVWVIAYC
jgi:hypothetical protein